jgi:GntR family transcriptional regulator / MocR family aminotransferase
MNEAQMTQREFTVELNPKHDVPLYRQLIAALMKGIRTGRLPPGSILPGSRRLATSAKVHRNTVLAAYSELQAEGWLTALPSGGTFVARGALSGLAKANDVRSDKAGFSVPAPLSIVQTPRLGSDLLVMNRSAADTRLFPTTALARAYRTVLQRHGRSLLFFGDPRGQSALREQLANMLRRTRGLPITADNVLITHGSQMAVDLLARSLFGPGDVIAVESLGYPHVWSALRLTGATLLPVPVDESGMSVVALEALTRKHSLKAVYLTPHHQFPTTIVMSATRRMQLLALAQKQRFAIIEDDYDHEFHYDGRPVLPIASHDNSGVVIYVGTLSKCLAVGLRLGFIAAPTEVINRLVSLRASIDIQGDHVLEAAIADMFEQGEIQQHIKRARRVYHARRDALADSLQQHLPSIQVEVPPGGMALWVRTPDDVDVERWSERALQRGVLIRSGRMYEFDSAPTPHLRLGFTLNDERENDEAVRRMAKSLTDGKSRSGVGM